eukprot:jgi/Galph1/5762/GphlegSOOS_G4322.1
MGVPKFYRWISERYPLTTHKVSTSITPDIDNFYLDVNGILHSCSRPKDAQEAFPCQYPTQEEIFLATFNYIDMLFSIVRPKHLVYIAIDGVAPRAKMNQQRARRFRTAKDRAEEWEQRVLQGKSLPNSYFDSNCITPGTEFMQKFSEALKYLVHKKITEDKAWASVEVILSTTDVPGEGEHKIIEYIRRNKCVGNWRPNICHCLYGLDADLIMLSLVTHEPHFILLREKTDLSQLFNRKGKQVAEATPLDRCITGEFEFFSIGVLREYLDKELSDLTIPFYDLEHWINDFIFLCFLVGNDFLPQIPTLNIAEEHGNLVLERFEIFVSKLGLLERLVVNRRLEAISNANKRPPRTIELGINHDELWGLSNPETDNNMEDAVVEPWSREDIDRALEEAYVASVDPVMESVKESYYQDKLGINPRNGTEMEQVKVSYLRGLIWTWQYYYSGCPCWKWYYPFYYAPMASDLVGLSPMRNDIFVFTPSEPFLPFQQLLAVLPPQSSNFLPKALQRLLYDANSPIRHFYPRQFSVDMDGKRNAWEGVVKLPFVDEKLLLEVYGSISETAYSLEEKHRNVLRNAVVYRHKKWFQNGQSHKHLMHWSPKSIISPFPNHMKDIEETFAVEESLQLAVIPPEQGFEPVLYPGTEIGIHSPGNFPTLLSLQFSINFAKIGVNIFGIPSRKESMIIQLEHLPEHMMDSEQVRRGNVFFAPGKRVLVEYPWRCEANVFSVITKDGIKISKIPAAQECKEERLESDWFVMQVETQKQQMMSHCALDIGNVKYLVGLHLCDKRDPSSGAIVSYSKEEIWLPANVIIPIHLSTRLKNSDGYLSSVMSELHSGDVVIYIGEGPYFGRLAKVIDNVTNDKRYDRYGNTSSLVEIKFLKGTVFGKQQSDKMDSTFWFSLSETAKRLQVTVSVVSKLTGSVFVKTSKSAKENIDIGLRVKFTSRDLFIPGYCRKVGVSGTYELSSRTIDLLQQYKEKFPFIFELLQRESASYNVTSSQGVLNIFEFSSNAVSLVESIREWLKSLEIAKLPLLPSTSQVMSKEDIEGMNLQPMLNKPKTNEMSNEKSIIVPRKYLLVGDEHEKQQRKTNLSLYKLQENITLTDRVVNISASGPVPFGLQGTVVGIHGTELEVVFDETFPGGTDLHHRCPAYRGKTLHRNTVLKLNNQQMISSEEPRKRNNPNKPFFLKPKNHSMDSSRKELAITKDLKSSNLPKHTEDEKSLKKQLSNLKLDTDSMERMVSNTSSMKPMARRPYAPSVSSNRGKWTSSMLRQEEQFSVSVTDPIAIWQQLQEREDKTRHSNKSKYVWKQMS